MRRAALRRLALLAVLAAPAGAALALDDGLPLAGGRLHPSLEVEELWDSNALYQGAGHEVSDLVLHVRPGLTWRLEEPSTQLEAAGQLDWTQYQLQPATRGLSRVLGDARLGMGLNRTGGLGLEVSDELRRFETSPTVALGSAVVSSRNVAEVGLPWRPGGGALTVAPVGSWTYQTFEPFYPGASCMLAGDPGCGPDLLSRYAYHHLTGGLSAQWRFLPRTAVLLEGGGFWRRPTDTVLSPRVSGVRALAGLSGLVTRDLAATVKLGWGDALRPAPGYQTWLAQLEVQRLAAEGRYGWRLGYQHGLDADVASQGGYYLYGLHRGYGEGSLRLVGRVSARLLAGWERYGYPLEGATTDVVRASPSLEWELTRWVGLAAGWGVTWRRVSVVGAPLPGDRYAKNEAWLRVVGGY